MLFILKLLNDNSTKEIIGNINFLAITKINKMSNKIEYKFSGVKRKHFITLIGSSMPIVEVKNKIIKNLNLKQTHYRSLTVLDYHTAKG